MSELVELVFTVRGPNPQAEAAECDRIVKDARAFGLVDVEVTSAAEVVIRTDAVSAYAFRLHMSIGNMLEVA
jgi:hypothetical protein